MLSMRPRLTIAVLVLLLAPVAQAAAPTLPARLAKALAVPNVAPSASGAIAVDLRTFAVLFEQHADTPLMPASNEKLPTTFAALRELGPYYRFRTEVLGSGYRDGPTWVGNLILKGYGDPTLSSRRLAELAAEVKAQGIQRVTGRVLGDESWFDSRRVVAGWKSSFYISESAPLSALTVDRRSASNPALAAAAQLRALLRARGIAVAGTAAAGRAPPDAFALATTYSVPLAEIVRWMDRESDNFVAEQILKTLGAEVGAAGTSAGGAAVVMRVLREAGIPVSGVRIVDGSGLSRSDRVTTRALAAILVAAWTDPDLHDTLWGALPVAGVNGTLDHRFRTGAARGTVRAKTGTTGLASALSGYVRDRYVFAVVQNGSPISTTWARTAQDRFAQALAADAAVPVP
jgi:serine-type D-Ala-D-Ala carboxypeptidase/endopeptidase (penicillin-binding protein 4)